jgi:hypothetical protein
MSIQNSQFQWSIKAGEDLDNLIAGTGHIFKAIRSVDGKFANDAKSAIGILQYVGEEGQHVSFSYIGLMKYVAGTSIDNGDVLLTIATSGYCVEASSGDYIVGKALDDTTSGSVGYGIFNFSNPSYYESSSAHIMDMELQSFVAQTDLSTQQYKIVDFSTGDIATSSNVADGVLIAGVGSGEIGYGWLFGKHIVAPNDNISNGRSVKCDSGYVIPADSGDLIIGRAIEDLASGTNGVCNFNFATPRYAKLLLDVRYGFAGEVWYSMVSAANNNWFGVTYGNGLFVAVANSGVGNRVMTSEDGITWTIRTSAANNGWISVTYGNGLFVAVANSGIGNRVMTSPDGINWTIRTSAADNNWYSVTYGNGLFVAVSITGTGNRVMTSENGINWTIRTSAADNSWLSVTYGNGLFVAVATSGTNNRVMTSEDGITWTIRTSAADNDWLSVTYGNGLFVAVSITGTGNRVMTSEDGITWTIRTSAADNNWYNVTYGNGLFVAVANSGTGNRVMTSEDGITWTIRSSAADNFWRSVIYGNGRFVATSITGTNDRVMISTS